MGKTNKNSVEYCFNHTKERMMKRHSLEITRDEYDALCSKYNSQELIKIINIEENQCVFETEFKGKELRFVWCNKRKAISTVFSMDDEIRVFLKRDKEETEAFLKAWTEKDPGLCLESKATFMFSAGVRKYGLKWSRREYVLRNEEK